MSVQARPELYTSYEQDMALLNTPGKRRGVAGLLLAAVALPFLVADNVLVVLAIALVACIGTIGLNIVTGYAGQVSLGHAFFLGIGAYTAAALSGDPADNLIGFGITFMPLWLFAAGAMAALVGLIVSPLAVRLRGLYLAIVTLGLVFLGEHLFKEWASLTGGPGVGRPAAIPDVFGFRFNVPSEIFGIPFSREQKLYLLMLFLMVVFAVAARNLARSDVGRALSAVRDRDIAAEVIGISLAKHKAIAFTVSSFYAGVAGALLYTISGFLNAETFNLGLSVQYIAMVLIGGAATISGSIMGAIFISTLGRFTREVLAEIPVIERLTAGALSVQQLEGILYGLLIIGFLIFEPRGLFGIWVRVRNYWKGWPFSY